jgi:ferritin heavy chain
MSRQNWSDRCEQSLNEHIKIEYQASYHYHLLSSYFDRDNVGLKKLVEYFNKCSKEEREHADNFMRYQCLRGGKVQLYTLPVPDISTVESNEQDVLKSFELALNLEKSVNQALLNLHKVAEEEGDPQFSDYIEGEYLKEQVEAIDELAKIVSQLERFGTNHAGIWNFIQHKEL